MSSSLKSKLQPVFKVYKSCVAMQKKKMDVNKRKLELEQQLGIKVRDLNFLVSRRR